MASVRRVNDRRRRVLYSAHQTERSTAGAANRNEARRLREARRPHAVYCSRVQRRLRARWFSLVPVGRRPMFTVSGIVVTAVAMLCLAHHAAVSWPSIAYRPEIARPLRLDHSDSFGHFLMLAMLGLATGISLLIYQLRRYRNDDFKGRYRLWRLVLIAMALASLNTTVGLIDWGGALLDTVFGKRVTLTGSDWVRLVVSFGGLILAIRVIAEVRRCRSSLLLMVAACATLAIPEAAKWNALSVETLSRWLLVTSAPLVACTLTFLSLLSYLRMLYREVRQIEDGESLLLRLRERSAGWFRRSRAAGEEGGASGDTTVSAVKEPSGFSLRLRRKKPDPTIQPTPASTPKRAAASPKPELKPEPEPEQKPEDGPEGENRTAEKRSQRFGWFRRKKATDAQASSDPQREAEQQGNSNLRVTNANSTNVDITDRDDDGDDDVEADDDANWNSLNKSERRRLRKQMKRQNRAA